jgi:hypothetical protein
MKELHQLRKERNTLVNSLLHTDDIQLSLQYTNEIKTLSKDVNKLELTKWTL